jgi:ABC-type multidrug transport system ATPase subunit
MKTQAPESRDHVETQTLPPIVRLEPPVLSLHDVTKRWNRRKPPVLDGVSLVLDPGRLVSLVGHNGAGKTTLLRIASALIAPDSGIVRVDGLHPQRDRREYQHRIGFLSAGSAGLYGRLSARRHLELWSRLALLPSAADRRAAIERAVERFELADFARRRVDRVSMGQRQRVRLAMAFLHEPRLALLDEPWSSLDPEGIAVLKRVLHDFTATGRTAICCAPTSDEIADVADDEYCIENGRIERR